jgi:hypothetical protein
MDSALNLPFRFVVIAHRLEGNQVADILAAALALTRAIIEAAVISGLNILDLVIFLWEQVGVNKDHSLGSIHPYHRKAILDSMLRVEDLVYQEVYLGQTMAFMVSFDQFAHQQFYNLHDSHKVFKESKARTAILLLAKMDLLIHIPPLQYLVLQTSA